jgi:hypothetical protein
VSTTAQDRRSLTAAVLGSAVGAGLVLWAASRTWVVTQTVRAAPQPPLVTPRSGGSLSPLLPALAFVALACAGGLLATRSWARLAVGVVLALGGFGLIATATTTDAVNAWPVVAVLGAVLVVAAGVLTLWRSRTWPAMGARYEARARDDSAAGMWDAIDHGHDPTLPLDSTQPPDEKE